MTIQAFAEKIRKLDPRLYLDFSTKTQIDDEWSSISLKGRRTRNETPESDLSTLSGEAARLLDAHLSGNIDEFVSGVSYPEVPEISLFRGQSEVARSWRVIVLAAVKRGYGSMERAKRIFSRSLGETQYDRMPLHEKKQIGALPEVDPFDL